MACHRMRMAALWEELEWRKKVVDGERNKFDAGATDKMETFWAAHIIRKMGNDCTLEEVEITMDGV